MLFNSYAFILLFLPVCLAGYFACGRVRTSWAVGWLALASLAFYAWWDYRYVPLLLASITFNYYAGTWIGRARNVSMKRARLLLTGAVIVDLVLLGYYKYADFFIGTVNMAAGLQVDLLHIVLPLGISFFTFTQIAFLADSYAGHVSDYRFPSYVLFVTYFPHLIAGPILHHRDMIPQFVNPESSRARSLNFEAGLTIFAIGLAKKVLIADSLAPHANAFFGSQETPTLLVAWGGVLAYAFQLYFDFSGYSDMAIGLSRLFGIQLPLNFNSPYKAVNISDFWRRWHMTLSRFLRDYLYVPLGGNRRGPVRRYANLAITMLLGGLWHGAGWTFVVWGGLHGFYLIVNHGWQALKARLHLPPGGSVARGASVLLTFVAVCFAWVFFRAPDIVSAGLITKAMLGLQGIAVPAALTDPVDGLEAALKNVGVQVYLGGGRRFIETYAWVSIAAVIAFACPNTQEIVRMFSPALDAERPRAAAGRVERLLVWRPTWAWSVTIGGLLAVAFLALSRPTEFLYFQF